VFQSWENGSELSTWLHGETSPEKKVNRNRLCGSSHQIAVVSCEKQIHAWLEKLLNSGEWFDESSPVNVARQRTLTCPSLNYTRVITGQPERWQKPGEL
jgi:hypothetical protein